MTRVEVGRLERLRGLLSELNLDAALVTALPNVRYFSGYTGTSAWLFVSKERSVLITDFRYQEQSRKELDETGIELVIREGGYVEELKRIVPAGVLVGFEGDSLPVSSWERLTSGLEGRMWINLRDRSSLLRMVKEATEVEAVVSSLRILETSFQELVKEIRPGMTERQAAVRFEAIARENGADAIGFESIVASGPRGALPHGTASERVMEAGEVVVLDLGLLKDGYNSDMTRMVSLGEPKDPEVRQVWSVVDAAVRSAAKEIRPGMTGREADHLARTVIETAGYGDFFGHSLGHGVGLEVHEAPAVGPNSDQVLPVGTLFTIEPGIYLPRRFGIRLEEMAVLTEDGIRLLNSLPRDLFVV